MSTWQVDPADAGLRLDRFLARECPGISRSRLQDRIRSGHARVNGQPARPSQDLRAGDQIVLDAEPPPAPATVAAEEMPLAILHEDAGLVVLDKPAGVVVHPGAGHSGGTLVNALLHHCGGLSSIGGVERPGIIHRLDKETSGCLVIAKNDAVHQALSAQFARREVAKTYLALVEGVPRAPHGTIDRPIGRHPVHRQKMAVVERGRDAFTAYRVLAAEARHSLVECRPKTGRTHQIRVHLKELGHPVAGDPVYGRRGTWPRHLLHAWRISFVHPATGKTLSFEAPVPPDFPDWARAAVQSAK